MRSETRNRWICKIFGHRPGETTTSDVTTGGRPCRCGVRILGRDETETRIRHAPKCFFAGHSCTKVRTRHGYHDYVCLSCGHPILIKEGGLAHQTSLKKRQRYLCSVFGHNVDMVCQRDGFNEYACNCGHSFLKEQEEVSVVRHPLVCLVSGHFIRRVGFCDEYTEFCCRNCGHTFYFEV